MKCAQDPKTRKSQQNNKIKINLHKKMYKKI